MKLDAIHKLGGNYVPDDGNHRNYSFPGGVKVEFHPNLLHPDLPIGTQINPGWQYAQSTSNASPCRDSAKIGNEYVI